ncbi:hypothetical protein Bca52824_065437 [Brassica carinata]|uniref:Uncharacterized protein n=1 Tax=Brassica carinata TaxID=52824 RepID=A0A8X7QKB1_BRACI|nr:hypothetical protein Bca52824_065437 [Brassica carinata]
MIAADYDNGFYTSLALKIFSIVREASSFPVNHSTHNVSLSLVDVDLLVAQHERTDICGLKEENDRIRCENIAIRESLKHTICPTCCDTPVHEDSYFDEQKLRLKRHSLEKRF